MFAYRYRYLFILLLAVYSFLNILFTEGDKLFGFVLNPIVFFAVLQIMVLGIWEGNRFLVDVVMPKKFGKIHPLVILFAVSLLNVLFITLITTLGLRLFISPADTALLTFKLALGFAFRVNLFLHSINAITFFISEYKNAQVEAERLKKQNAEARFEALRNQISPHFLFNSFNVLSSLVHKDAEMSSKFIDQLSKVYRYLLYNQDNKIVPLRDELAFIESYIFLLRIRFADNLQVNYRISETLEDKYIAPATLQLLIENAIKHNIVSKSQPLKIELFDESDQLIVKNNVQLKPVKEASSQLGLKNIRERYAYLSEDRTIEVIEDDYFTVKIPLIEVT